MAAALRGLAQGLVSKYELAITHPSGMIVHPIPRVFLIMMLTLMAAGWWPVTGFMQCQLAHHEELFIYISSLKVLKFIF